MTGEYLPRLFDARIQLLFGQLPAIMMVGPRAAGKTTSARRHVQSIVRLDRPAEAGAFEADADAALKAMPEPVLLDEWQEVPTVLGAVKRAVDSDPRPGRFILTGSVRADIDAATWPGTGRVVRLPVYGLSRREIEGAIAGAPFLERLAANDVSLLTPSEATPDLTGYVEMALEGGYPEVSLRLSGEARVAWLDGYLDQLLTRDVAHLTGRRRSQLMRYFEVVALNTAGVVEHKTMYDAAHIDRDTAVAYDALLADLFAVEEVPAWLSNRLSRLVKRSKRYVVDPSLVAAALRLDVRAVLRDSDVLGRLLETFVAAQLRPELDLGASRARLYHLREKDGRREIDLVAELSAHRVVGVEVKASAAPTMGDAKHLRWLRDELGERFVAGAVMHTGPRAFQLDDRIYCLPIASIWGPASG